MHFLSIGHRCTSSGPHILLVQYKRTPGDPIAEAEAENISICISVVCAVSVAVTAFKGNVEQRERGKWNCQSTQPRCPPLPFRRYLSITYGDPVRLRLFPNVVYRKTFRETGVPGEASHSPCAPASLVAAHVTRVRYETMITSNLKPATNDFP